MSEWYQLPGFFLTAVCHIIVIYHMAEHKYSKRKYVLYGCIYAACFVSLAFYGAAKEGMLTVFSYAGIVLCTFLFSCIVSRDCFSKKCFLYITYFCLFSVLDNMMKFMMELFLPRIAAPAGHYAAIALRSAALLLILVLYKRYVVAAFRSLADVSWRRWWNLTLIALLFYLLQASLSLLKAQAVIGDVHVLFWLLAAISFLMCAVYGVVFSNIRYMKKDAEAALVQQNAAYLSNQLSVLQKAEETHRRLRHDIRHHLETIAEYAKAGDNSAILAYIREYRVEISETAVRQYSVNSTVNNILSVYGGKAEESDIAFSVRCNIPAKLTVRDIDMIALLGNLLENALHGCQRSGKGKPCIEIHIRQQNGRLIILCNNTCPDNLALSGSLPTGKSIGISSILAVCQKYDGNLDYKVENGSCSACAVLNL